MPFERNFTSIPNAWARDEKLSRKARGLLVELLSHDVNWSVTLEALAKVGPEGIAAIRTARDELVEQGYLICRPNRRGLPDDWELCDPSGLHDPALIPYADLRDEPVENSHSKIAGPVDSSQTTFENRTRTAFENRTPIEDQLRSNSIPSATTGGRGLAPVDKDGSADSHQPASASSAVCQNGHPIVGYSGGGTPFCARSCAPVDFDRATPTARRSA